MFLAVGTVLLPFRPLFFVQIRPRSVVRFSQAAQRQTLRHSRAMGSLINASITAVSCQLMSLKYLVEFKLIFRVLKEQFVYLFLATSCIEDLTLPNSQTHKCSSLLTYSSRFSRCPKERLHLSTICLLLSTTVLMSIVIAVGYSARSRPMARAIFARQVIFMLKPSLRKSFMNPSFS